MPSVEELRERFYYDSLNGVIYSKGLTRKQLIRFNDKPAGHLKTDGYIYVKYKQKQILAQRLAWVLHYGVWPKRFIDHRDMNKQNLKIENLREATATQNQANVPKWRGKTSKYKGVCYNKQHKRYVASIRVNYKLIYLGAYHSEEAAHAAYVKAAAFHFGEFARAA